jgi:hypothetical protein
MMDFNQWRNKYDTLTFAEQVEYHNQLELLYPGQAHYDLQAAKHVIDLVNPKTVIEAGCWKADLAAEILKSNDIIEDWKGVEICTNAIKKTVCKDGRMRYREVASFTWWNNVRMGCDLFIATHFIEHLSLQHFAELAKALKSRFVYFEAPLSDTGEPWDGYHGTHKLPIGWNRINEIMASNGYAVTNINHHCKLYAK